MALVTLLREIFRLGARYGSRYYRLEGQAFNKLYRGFPQSKTIGRGVRHGLTAGSIAGSLINTADDSPGNGSQIPFTKQQPSANKSYQTRRRYPKRDYCRRDQYRDSSRRNRYAYTRSN